MQAYRSLTKTTGRRPAGALLRVAAVQLAAVVLGGCSGLPDACKRGEAIDRVQALSSTQVEVIFACRLDETSAADAAHYEVGDFAAAPPALLQVVSAAADGERVVLATASQIGGVTYTLRVDGVRDAAGNALVDSANFAGAGDSRSAPVTFRVDDRYNANLTEVWLLVSIDPATGRFSHQHHRVRVEDADGDHVFDSTLSVAVDPARTVDESDDQRGGQFIAYNVRAVDAQNRPLSDLVLFAVADDKAQTVDVRLLSVPPPPPPEGLVTVTFTVDDRPAAALSKPELRGSFDSQGVFDAGFPSVIALTDANDDHVWEGTAKVRIAPGRVLGGATEATQPYSAYLVEAGEPRAARSADFVVPDEKAVGVTILVGNKDKVPVTFRVDVASSWLDTSGTIKGVYPGEAVFLTGELSQAEDAFGANASDAFSGGENVVLQMVERADRPGVWERTLFLGKNRPYGWKVVRCPKDKGCTQLNKLVLSSGRAFPTVMKNLVTELCDASKQSWPDANCASPRLVDPRQLDAVDTGQGVLDYRGASIHAGTGAGPADQQDPAGTPNAAVMFKQEAPDLVADVKDQPVVTPVYVVGSWRDVNIPGTPGDIVANGQVIDLSKTDYDAGLIGVLPPSYEITPAPKPSPFVMDGKLDSGTKLLSGGGGQMPLHAAINGDYLYLATDDAGEGSDHFLLVSATVPSGSRGAPWSKAGTVAFAGKTLFLADENDSSFAGWFELGAPDTLLVAQGSGPSGGLDVATGPNGGVIEGSLHLPTIFGAVPATVYVATGPWNTADGGALYSAAQAPPSKDGNGNIEAGEILKVALPSLQVQQ